MRQSHKLDKSHSLIYATKQCLSFSISSLATSSNTLFSEIRLHPTYIIRRKCNPVRQQNTHIVIDQLPLLRKGSRAGPFSPRQPVGPSPSGLRHRAVRAFLSFLCRVGFWTARRPTSSLFPPNPRGKSQEGVRASIGTAAG